MKKISALLALVMSGMIIASGCNNIDNDDAPNGGDVTGGAVTSVTDAADIDDETIATIAPPPSEDIFTEPVETIPPEEIYEKPETPAPVTWDGGRYVYSKLSAEDKKIYDAILDAATNFKNVAILDTAITNDKMLKIFCSVYYEEPQLFWLRGSVDKFEGTSKTVSLYYRYDYAQVQDMKKKIDAKADEIVKSIPAGSSAVDKLRVLHNKLALAVDFSMQGDNVTNIYGALVEGYAQCEGYAKAMGYLCDKAGIENMLVPGKNTKGETHAWTKVRVDGDWYNLDVTWDDPMNIPDKTYMRFNYFLVTDAEINNKSHFPITTYFSSPACTATKANYFRTYGLYAENIDQAKQMLASELKKASDSKTAQVQIKCSDTKLMQDLKKDLENGGLKGLLDQAKGKYPIKNGTCALVLDENVMTFQIRFQF